MFFVFLVFGISPISFNSVSRVDLMQLVEEAIDGCWIGHRARTAMGDSGIGSVYAPPSEDHGSAFTTRRKHVETVVDIGYRSEVNFIHFLLMEI
jgi:hypothetical protein